MDITSYKTCAASMCNNTTIRTPQKLFIPLPYKPRIRKHWLELAGKLPNAIHRTTSAYFCEDHFDLPNDMKNYATYRATGKVARILIRSGCLPSKFPGQPISSTSTDCQSLDTEWDELDIKSEYEEEMTSDRNSKDSVEENSYQSTITSELTDLQTHTAEWSRIKVKSEFEDEMISDRISKVPVEENSYQFIASELPDIQTHAEWSRKKVKSEFEEEVIGELTPYENLNSKIPSEAKGCQLTIASNSTDFCQPLSEDGGNLELKMECEEEVISSEKLNIKPTQDKDCQSAVSSKLIGVCRPIVLKINRPSVKSEFEEKKTESVFTLSEYIKKVLSEYEDKYNEEMESKKCHKAVQVNITHKFRSKGTQTKIQTSSSKPPPPSKTSPKKKSKKPVSTSSFKVINLKPTVSYSSRKHRPAILRSSGKRK